MRYLNKLVIGLYLISFMFDSQKNEKQIENNVNMTECKTQNTKQ